MSSRYEIRIGLWLRGLGLPPHEVEYPFGKADGRRWRIDYAWPGYNVGVEIDGGARLVRWQTNPRTGKSQPVAVGRHGTATDYEKLNYAAENGWRILRFNPDMLTQPDYVLGAISRTLASVGAILQGNAATYAARALPALRSRRRPAPSPAPRGSLRQPGSGGGPGDRGSR